MRGRVVVCKEHNRPFVIEEYTVPEIEPGAILLRMVQSGICGSDLHYWRGDQAKAPLPPTGRVMGHEGYGVVHSLGSGADRDSLGAPAARGRPGSVHGYISVQPLSHVPEGSREPLREPSLPSSGGLSVLHRDLRRLSVSAAGASDFPGAGRDIGRGPGSGQLRHGNGDPGVDFGGGGSGGLGGDSGRGRVGV